MGLIASLPEIDKHDQSVFVMHEKSEKLIPLHSHKKGQLSYVEGGIAYITIYQKTYVVPARHYFWIPRAVPHVLRLGHSATVLRSLYFYGEGDDVSPFYGRLGIYPASELLIQMISYTERWDGLHVLHTDYHFDFLVSLKKLLPEWNNQALPIVLPITENERMLAITGYLSEHTADPITLSSLSEQFHMSDRSMSRMFQTHLHISFLQYFKTLRMIRAIELLVKTGKPVAEIAFAVGYDSVASFSNAFHALTQSRPTELRKM